MKWPLGVMMLAAAVGLSAGALADDMAMPKMAPNAGFDEMKTLAGSWDGTTADGKEVKATYQVVSAGSVVMETLDPPDHGTMITMYRVEGGKLMLDHYCSMNNVPHMKATVAPDGKSINFEFVSASNLASPKDTHMHGLKITFKDPDHLTHEWSLHSQGKVSPVMFELSRVKM
jgi:hypothetical protein